MMKKLIFSLALIGVVGSSTLCFSDNQKDIESVTVEGELRFALPIILRNSSAKLTQVKKGDKIVVTGKASAIVTLGKLINLVKSGKAGTVEALPVKALGKNGKANDCQWTSFGTRKDSGKLFKVLRDFGMRNRKTELLHFAAGNILLVYGPEQEVASLKRLVKACEAYHKAMTEKKK